MTDNDIIKALECCAGEDVLCKDCVYLNNPPYPACKNLAATQALSLINRQKAEIEELKEIVFMDRTEAIKNLKSEAIKEFAERLKEKAFPDDSIYTRMVVEVEDIDNLVKEMTEEE